MKYVIVRTKSAGCFAGFLKEEKDGTVVLTIARRLWQWSGACSLSQLAQEGTKDPKGCKFPCPVNEIKLFEVIEIIDVTKAAQENIEQVPEWKQ
jgi:hypothetical protein